MKLSTFERKFMTCNNRRLELVAEVISSILNLSAQSRLQFLNTKAFTSISKRLATTTRASPHSPELLAMSALPKEILSSYCARQQNLSTKNSLLWSQTQLGSLSGRASFEYI